MQPDGIVIASEADLERLIQEHIHPPDEGEECMVCGRLAPKAKSDDKAGPRRSVIQLSEPKGFDGVLENMMIAVVDKYKEQWPREHAAMRHEVGLEVVGGRSWKYWCAHFALYAVLMVPGLEPTEEG